MKMKGLCTFVLAFALTGTLAVSAAAQDQNQDRQDHDRYSQNGQVDQDHNYNHDQTYNRDQNYNHDQTYDRDQNYNRADQGYNRTDRDHDRWENRNGWEYRTFTSDQRPDGWMQGHRTRSSYCGGHNDCYVYEYQGSPYYYYRDDNGQMVVRRRHHRDHHRDVDRDYNHDYDQR